MIVFVVYSVCLRLLWWFGVGWLALEGGFCCMIVWFAIGVCLCCVVD